MPTPHSYDCPSCGATLTFQSSVMVSAVCPFCQSLVLRSDLDVQTLGTLAQLPADLSPLQIGTTGNFLGQSFRLAGRLRWHWEGGSWTEWFAEMPNGPGAWLSETQGFYTFSAVTHETGVPDVETLSAGRSVLLTSESFTVTDVKKAVCVGGEGELPEPVVQGTERLSADLQGNRGEFATLEKSDGPTELFMGRYAHFKEFGFGNLRPIPGWTPGHEAERQEGLTRSFSCPNCAAPVGIRAAGLTMSSVCGSCGTIIDTSDERHQILEEANARLLKMKPLIPIGKRGLFRKVEYEMIGFVRRKDLYAAWSEYLLFNPWQGFLWLVTYRGHWTVIERLLESPTVGAMQAYESGGAGGKYDLYAKYEARVEAVLGEFYWQTSTSEVTEVSDYIAPPYVVSREIYPGLQEVTWSKGEYVSGKEIGAAFGLEKMEEPAGIYLNQPNPYREKWSSIRWPLFMMIGLLCVMQVYFATTTGTRKIFGGDYTFRQAEAARVLTTAPFNLPPGSGKVVIKSTAPLANNWIGFDLALIEEKTGKRYEQDIGMEKYSGVSSDGAWTEGKDHAEASLGDVPGGLYRLVIETSADPNISEIPFNLSVHRGGVFWSNFWMCLIFAAIYPIYLLFRTSSFERTRWSESDYSPHAEDDDE